MREFKIGDYWTLGDLNAYIQRGWSLSSAKPKVRYIDIPEGDGSIDLTGALTGEVSYYDRDFKAVFIFPPQARKQWETYRKKFSNAINGQRLSLILPDDPDHYLVGRFTIGAYDDSQDHATLEVTAQCEPWMYKREVTHVEVSVATTRTLTLYNEKRPVAVTVTTDHDVSLSWGSSELSVAAGTYTLPDLKLGQGATTVKITGTAKVIFEYQEGSL